MMKKTVIAAGTLGIVLVLAVFACLWNIRGEFREHLAQTYPRLTFKVGFTRIDPVYGKFYAEATCREDGTVFPLSKSFNTQVIREDYLGYKSRNQYNERLREIFMSSGLNGEIKSVTGGGKTPYQNDGNYEQINFSLAKESDHPAVARKILGTLQGQGISASVIIMVYEKDDHVYELRLSQADYSLSEQELERKIRKLK